MQSRRFFPRIAITLICLLGCERAPQVVTMDVTPRHAIRADAVGCWVLRASAKGISPAESLLIRLDTVVAMGEVGSAARVVHRLDERGHALLRDAEGFTVQDSWAADTRSDSIRLVFNNGLYGSVWALALTARVTARDTLRGSSRVFGDVVPEPAHPVRAATGIRIRCADATAAATGV